MRYVLIASSSSLPFIANEAAGNWHFIALCILPSNHLLFCHNPSVRLEESCWKLFMSCKVFKRACSPSTWHFPDSMPETDHSTCFWFSSLCWAHRLSCHRNMKLFSLVLFWQVMLSFALILYYLSPPAGQEGGSWLITCLEIHSSFELKHCNHWGM